MVLSFMNQQLAEIGVPYRFWEWAGEPPQTYFVGEFIETGGYSEDGRIEGEFTLSGFSRESYSALDVYRDLIYKRFRTPERAVINGRGVAVVYSHALLVPSGLDGVKRMEIYLSTNEWSE